MKKSLVLKILNPIVAVLFVNQAASGIFRAAIPYEVFEITHAYAGYVFAGVVVVHLIYNWNWVVTNYFKKKPNKS